MSDVIRAIHGVLGAIVDALIWPLRTVAPIYSLIWISVLAGIGCLFIYGMCSNQTALKRVKRSIYGGLLESLLYRHDIRTCLAAQGRMLVAGCRYLSLAITPMLVLLIPVLLLLGALNVRYGYRPLGSAEPVVVSAVLDPSAKGSVGITAGGRADDPPVIEASVHIPQRHEVTWRLAAPKQSSAAAEHGMIITAADAAGYRLEVSSGEGLRAIDAAGYDSWWESLLFGGTYLEPALKLREYRVAYREREYKIFGAAMPWLVIFFLVSLLAGIVASKVFKIEI